MKKLIMAAAVALSAIALQAKTLVAYYSYTNNVEHIVGELRSRIQADVVEIEPAQKDLDYAANNYAIGSAQIAAIRNNPGDAASYPAIDPVDVNLADYDCVIIGTPLWWSNMAAPMQTFLFQHGGKMAGKNIGPIVSSASSGISGVESDARRLVPGGHLLSPSLWIRSSQTSNAGTMIDSWLRDIDYSSISAAISNPVADSTDTVTVYSLSGVRLLAGAAPTDGLPAGVYIVNVKKTLLGK